jgi:hypothetical protein
MVDALRASVMRREDVEEAPQERVEQDEMTDDERAVAMPTIEASVTSEVEIPYSPKRRRLDGNEYSIDRLEQPSTSNRPSYRPLVTPAPDNQATQRFATPPISVGSTADDERLGQRLPFLRAAVPPLELSEPLPEIFSPHRRGQKFVPGGLASTVQQWVLEAGQAAVQNRRRPAYLRQDNFVLKAKLDAVTGNGPILAKASMADGEDINLLLTLAMSTPGSNARDLVAGSIVGVKEPCWKVQLRQKQWTICVDWKLLQAHP